MGLGDEIMALGRAEAIYEQTGEPVAICRWGGYPRHHDAWVGNPAWDEKSKLKILDGAGVRPYIVSWVNNRIVFNEEYRPRAGRIWLTEKERAFNTLTGDYAVVAPFLKENASVNKDWGFEKWEQVIAGMKIPVYQLVSHPSAHVIKGARRLYTSTFRKAAAIIAGAKVVMCNEGGTHHMAASMGVPAVVVFGSFISPKVTGYDFHTNIAVETPHGFCGRFFPCAECREAMNSITPAQVRTAVDRILQT